MNIDLAIRLGRTHNIYYDQFFDLLIEKTKRDKPVNVRFEEINSKDDDSGYCLYDGSEFTIVIDPRLPYGDRLMLWLHEAAHVHAPWGEKTEHSAKWGIEYAKLYRKFLTLYDSFWHTEVWKPVEGWKHYEVSNLGRVRSLTRKVGARGGKTRLIRGRLCNQAVSQTGGGSEYLQVTLSEGKAKTQRVHKLVAEAFLGQRPEGMYVCHGQAGNLCNHVANLSYETPSTNQKHRRRDGTAGKKVQDSLGNVYVNCNTASEATGIPSGSISRVCRGELKTTHGLGWDYV